MKHLSLLLLGFSFILAGCTGATVQTAIESPSPAPTETPAPSPSETPVPTAETTTNPSKTPVEVKKTVTPKPSGTVKGTSTNIQSGSSSTNININSNNTSVKITNRDGKRYAELNGKEVELDANGCYDYNDGTTKIHSCVN